MFQSLQIWDHPSISGKLDWYQAVANNKFPAKYLIARRIGVEGNFNDMSLTELWKLHEHATLQFLVIREQIRRQEIHLKEVNKPEQSLMDLNLELVNRMLASCTFCQWNCNVDRTELEISDEGKFGTCQLGEASRVGSYFHHRGEELVYRGHNGSGTIFFTSCNMRCQFCQNGNISQDKNNGMSVNATELAAIIWILGMEGCHNINFVGGDPTIHLHTIIRAIHQLSIDPPERSVVTRVMKIKSDNFMSYRRDNTDVNYSGEFNAPMLWNSNFFMSEDTMRILRTVIDIWLPDFKFGQNKKCATTLSRTPWYFDTVSRNHRLLHEWGEDYTIRHLVVPNHIDCCSKPILDWIGDNIPGSLVNIMDQYHPDSFTDPYNPKYKTRYKDISRRLTQKEFLEVLEYAKKGGVDFEMLTRY